MQFGHKKIFLSKWTRTQGPTEQYVRFYDNLVNYPAAVVTFHPHNEQYKSQIFALRGEPGGNYNGREFNSFGVVTWWHASVLAATCWCDEMLGAYLRDRGIALLGEKKTKSKDNSPTRLNQMIPFKVDCD